jgi:(p)ppGpp synthase/HD superfamily hydrolase
VPLFARIANTRRGDGVKNRDETSIRAILNDAISIAAIVHKEQIDKAGDPYILHPLRLMMKMTTDEARITAVLHDVVEDSRQHPPELKWDIERLKAVGFSDEIIEAIDGLTDRIELGEDYDAFVERASRNPISRKVKIADLEDNMNLPRMSNIGTKDLDRLACYHRSWSRLIRLKTSDGGTNHYGNAK